MRNNRIVGEIFQASKKIKYFLFIILTLLVAYQNYKGTILSYSFIYEYIQYNNIFTLNTWTDYVDSSPQFLPLWFLKSIGFNLTNDFILVLIYLLFGAVAIIYLNKLIYHFFNIQTFDQKLIILICTAFANFIILKAIWSSAFLPFINLQTYCAIQLIYPLFYFILRDRYTLSSIISALMIFIHFTVAWFPTIILCIYILIRNKFLDFKILNIFIPFFSLLIMYYLSYETFSNQSGYELKIIENIFARSLWENNLLDQNKVVIIYFIFSLFLFYYLKNKIIKNVNLNLFLNILLYSTILIQIVGVVWINFAYKYFPITSFAYLYFARAVLSYHILFILLVCSYLTQVKIPNIIKLFIFLSIYTLGRNYFSEKGVFLSILFIGISFVIYFISKKYDFNKYLNSNHTVYILFFYALIIQFYLINKNTIKNTDLWSIKNLNDLSQYNQFFSNKKNSYKDNVFKLRMCDDFLLFPVISKKSSASYDNYINIVSHKSVYWLDDAMYYYDYEQNLLNINKEIMRDKIIEKINKITSIKKIGDVVNLNNMVLFIDHNIFNSKIETSEEIKNNIIQFDKDFVLYVKNNKLLNEIKACVI